MEWFEYDTELLDTLCWCEDRIVQVPRLFVKAGKTLPCRLARCRQIAHDHGFIEPPRGHGKRTTLALSAMWTDVQQSTSRSVSTMYQPASPAADEARRGSTSTRSLASSLRGSRTKSSTETDQG